MASSDARRVLLTMTECVGRSDKGVPYEAPEEELKRLCCEVLPAWQSIDPATVQVSLVSGGITNSLFKLTADGVKPVLGRVYGMFTEKLIDREVEMRRMRVLWKCGFGAQVVAEFRNGRFETFLDSRPLEPSEMGDRIMITRIAERLADFHHVELDEPKECQLEGILADWMHKVDGLHFNDPTKQNCFEQNIDLHSIKAKMPDVQKFLRKCTSPVVLCHNDLLSGNILLMKEADRPFSFQSSPFTFIDFEYCSHSFRGFDLGNHFNEYAGFDGDFESSYPSEEQQRQFLTAYLERSRGRANIVDAPSVDSLMQETRKFSVMSHVYWGIWAIIQARYSVIDFDFLTYAQVRLEQFLKGYALLLAP